MRHDRVNYIAVGIFVLAMLTGLLFLLYQLTGKRGETDSYFTVYESVTGLRFGTPVYYEGYHVGQVEGIRPETHDGRLRFRVELSIQQGWHIPRGSTARMVATGLLAAMSINIEGGDSPLHIAPGAEIPGSRRNDVFTAVSEIANEITSLGNDAVRPLISGLDRRIDSLGDTIETHLPPILRNLETLSERLLRSADAIEDVLRKDNRAQVDAALRDLAAGAGDFRHLAADLRNSRRQLDALLQHTDGVVGEAGGILRENRPGLRTATTEMRRLLTNLATRTDGILYNLEDTARNLKEFSRSVRGNPAILLTPSGDSDPQILQ